MNIPISALRVFLATADTGNLEQAGKQIGRSPSAISMTLKQLSVDIGGELFVSDRKNQLTELGHFLYEEALSQVLYYNRSMSSVQAFAKGEIGKLELACVPSVATQLLPDVIGEFLKRWPDLEIDIRDTDSRSIMRAVTRGTVEIGLGGRPPGNDEIEFKPLFQDRLVLVASQGYPVSEQIPVPWSFLKDQRVIANGIIADMEFPDLHPFNTKAKLMARNTASLLALVKANVGMTILPQLSVPQPDTELVVIPFEDPQLKREVGILRRRNVPLSSVAQTFIRLFEELMNPQLNDRGEIIWEEISG